METNDYIIKDSSIYVNQEDHYLNNATDASLKIGVIRSIINIKDGIDIAYMVEVYIGGIYATVMCTRSSRFGGVYNYEEFTYRGYTPDESDASNGLFDFKQGDSVLIAYLLGDSREGIIVSGINHPGRPKLFNSNSDIVYESEFNGVNKSISKDGEYVVTFKGIQTNIADLKKPAGSDKIPAPKYNTEIGSSYYKFDKTGSYLLTDNSKKDSQSIFIDKKNGKVVITSGKTTLTIDKNKESYEIVNKKTTINSKDEWNLNTKKTNIKSSSLINMEASDIKLKGSLSQVGSVEIKGDIKQTGDLKTSGTFSSDGETKLAGGANALVFDIVLTIGTGNLGVPVISNNILLKTVLTKAT